MSARQSTPHRVDQTQATPEAQQRPEGLEVPVFAPQEHDDTNPTPPDVEALAAALGLTVHPAAAMFPLLPSKQLEELAEDIAANGLIEPIVTYNDQLIDGRNRLVACGLAGLAEEIDAHEWQGDPRELIPWIISKNIHRRHLGSSQRALIAAELSNMKVGDNQTSAGLSIGRASQMMNIGERSTARARIVRAEGSDEIKAAVLSGELSVTRAVEQIRGPKAAPAPKAPPAPLPPLPPDVEDGIAASLQPTEPTELEDGGLEAREVFVTAHLAAKAAERQVPQAPEPLPDDQRAPFDAYYTPLGHAIACLDWLQEQLQGDCPSFPEDPTIIEPSVGGGTWVQAGRLVWPQAQIDRMDLNPAAPGLTGCRHDEDAIAGRSWLDPWPPPQRLMVRHSWDLCAGNPPYKGDIRPWLDASLERADVVAYLLRETITGTLERLSWWQSHRPAWICKVLPRPKWGGPGARDSVDFADSVLIVWIAGHRTTRWDWIDASDDEVTRITARLEARR